MNGEPMAFPQDVWEQDGIGYEKMRLGGMSLHDWFASQAFAGFLGHPEIGNHTSWETVAEMSYDAADAMILERERRYAAAAKEKKW